MTIRECIDIVDSIKPNQYSDEDKVRWLSFLDGSIINDVLKTHEGYEGQYDDFVGYPTDNLGVSLVVSAPYDRLYTAYLKMKIDEENGETARYNNSMTMFNSYLTEYKRWYNKTHMPLSKRGGSSSSQSGTTPSLTKENIIIALGYTPAKEGDFATEDYVKEYAQEKGDYLTEVPDEYVTEAEMEAKGYLTDEQVMSEYSKKSEVGILENLTTTVKDTIVGAINWLNGQLTALTNRVKTNEDAISGLNSSVGKVGVIASHTGTTTFEKGINNQLGSAVIIQEDGIYTMNMHIDYSGFGVDAVSRIAKNDVELVGDRGHGSRCISWTCELKANDKISFISRCDNVTESNRTIHYSVTRLK